MSLNRSELPKAQKDKEPQRLYPTAPHIPTDLCRNPQLLLSSNQLLPTTLLSCQIQPEPLQSSPCDMHKLKETPPDKRSLTKGLGGWGEDQSVASLLERTTAHL